MTRERAKRMPDGKIYHYIMSDAAVEKEVRIGHGSLYPCISSAILA